MSINGFAGLAGMTGSTAMIRIPAKTKDQIPKWGNTTGGATTDNTG